MSCIGAYVYTHTHFPPSCYSFSFRFFFFFLRPSVVNIRIVSYYKRASGRVNCSAAAEEGLLLLLLLLYTTIGVELWRVGGKVDVFNSVSVYLFIAVAGVSIFRRGPYAAAASVASAPILYYNIISLDTVEYTVLVA